ncbi:hypothetical protein AC249_AIPGENE14216 [Exaiptasia diaphana]|nr:hypothetical protein AC249_AIPGENE14216 [Exaiptasia diaphana]
MNVPRDMIVKQTKIVIADIIVLELVLRISRQLQQRQQVPVRQVATMHDVPAVSDAVTGGEPSGPPIYPGGPPPYQLSPERLERVEEPLPPTYEQAVRESQDYSVSNAV